MRIWKSKSDLETLQLKTWKEKRVACEKYGVSLQTLNSLYSGKSEYTIKQLYILSVDSKKSINQIFKLWLKDKSLNF
tara:strand:- start:227 stop:457 length:231 start_codon:yes stop_codon:yes gene_type:complete